MNVQKQQVRIEMNGQLIDDIFTYMSTRPYREVSHLIGGIQAEIQANQNKIQAMHEAAAKEAEEKKQAEIIALEDKRREKRLEKSLERLANTVDDVEVDTGGCGECDGWTNDSCIDCDPSE